MRRTSRHNDKSFVAVFSLLLTAKYLPIPFNLCKYVVNKQRTKFKEVNNQQECTMTKGFVGATNKSRA